MLFYPGEEERIANLQLKLASQFDLADRVYDFWLKQEKDEWLAKSKVPMPSVMLAMMLNVQACRKFRTIVELCRRSEAFTAAIVDRSLFETVLAQKFLLSRRLCIVVEPFKAKPGAQPKAGFQAKTPSKNVRPKRFDWLSREFRAKLYRWHMYLADQRLFKRFEQAPGYKRQGKKLRKGVDAALEIECETELGLEWSFILRNRPHSYSGLRVDQLAKVCHMKLGAWYETIYPFESKVVHASDVMGMINIADEDDMTVQYWSSDAEVYGTMRAALMMFLANISILQQNIHFGAEAEMGLDSIYRSFKASEGEDRQ
jgi:hypothetical protein